MQNGLIHIYHGDGKGKTTAAVGLAVRCAGGGGKVLFCQFLKDGKSCEYFCLKNIENITLAPCLEDVKFTFMMNEEEKKAAAKFYNDLFENAVKSAADYDLLVLDEVLDVVNVGFLSRERLENFIENKPRSLEVVLTGRDPSDKLCEKADYITEMKKIKHPYDRGVQARKLIDK